MLAIVAAKDSEHQINLVNIAEYVPCVHGRDDLVAEHGHLPNPRIFRNECPLYPTLYPKTIYLVRDPRAVLVSLHDMYRILTQDYHTSLGEFVEAYLYNRGCFKRWGRNSIRWDFHVLEWMTRSQDGGQQILFVKYEDMIKSRREVLEGVVAFAGIPFEDNDISIAVERGSFEAMRTVEAKHGVESYPGDIGKRGRFIRQGRVQGWQEELDPARIRLIEAELGVAMQTVGYLP